VREREEEGKERKKPKIAGDDPPGDPSQKRAKGHSAVIWGEDEAEAEIAEEKVGSWAIAEGAAGKSVIAGGRSSPLPPGQVQ
jgi:hypothetical protein